MSEETKKENGWLIALEKIKGIMVSLFDNAMKVVVSLIICGAVVLVVYLLCSIEMGSQHNKSRLAQQIEVIIETDAAGGSSGRNLSTDDRMILINKLISNYNPATDTLEVKFNEHKKRTDLREILETITNRFKGDKSKKDVLNQVEESFNKIEGEFAPVGDFK